MYTELLNEYDNHRCNWYDTTHCTKMKCSIKDFFSKYEETHLLKKSLMENFIFCAVIDFPSKIYFFIFCWNTFGTSNFGVDESNIPFCKVIWDTFLVFLGRLLCLIIKSHFCDNWLQMEINNFYFRWDLYGSMYRWSRFRSIANFWFGVSLCCFGIIYLKFVSNF